MLSAHIASFLKLIGAQLEETSHGLHSVHHVHNIDCGIANILSLLEPNSEVVQKADQVSLKASSYISRHDPAFAGVSDGDGKEDADRFHAAQAASPVSVLRLSTVGRTPEFTHLAWHEIP
jgi:hypothetical protein